MADYTKLEAKIEEIIDDLKGICSQNGLSNQASEERIITTIFLYKFLNDKFMYNLQRFSKEIEMDFFEVLKNENDEMDAFYDSHSGDVAFSYEDTIQSLMKRLGSSEFYIDFDSALSRISANPRNDNFNIQTADGTRKPLFEGVSDVVDGSTKNNFAKAIFAAISQEKFDFSDAFINNFDFYSRIFEYLIKDYNVASGTYAEYFTPQAVSKIIAKILVGMSEKITASEIYDPAAGSGSLVLHLANELGYEDKINRAIVYSQDISNKSSRFLRINLLLNGLIDSLHNVIQGDTLLQPSHFVKEHDFSSGLKKFDYIVSNPPFKMDFSSTRDLIENKWGQTKNEEGLSRFFSGIPKAAGKNKNKMPIYLLFIQHIIYSLKRKGKAAIVVPTGFVTAKAGIEKRLRSYLVENNIISGVVSMPSNIFANTGTNVSILFLDLDKKDDYIILMDASTMGKKVKNGKNKKTVLTYEEEELIIDILINRKTEEKKSILVNKKRVLNFGCDLSASLYFPLKYCINSFSPTEVQIQQSSFMNEQLILKKQITDLECDFLSTIRKITLASNIPKFEDPEKLTIPPGWELVKLKNLFSFVKGKIPKEILNKFQNGYVPYLTIEHLKGEKTEFVENKGGVQVCNEVLMVMDGAASGSVYQGFTGSLGSTMAKLVIKKPNSINSEFLFYILKSLENEVSSRNTGSTVPHANKLFIENIDIALPVGQTLLIMNEYFFQLRKLTLLYETMERNLVTLNATLYSPLINGQIYISE
jgi:type I restriction enzyme M protein